jgi:hypothetical protein
MAGMFVRQRIVDFDQWKTAFDTEETDRKRYGLTVTGIFHDHDEPNMVIVALKVDDPDRAAAFAKSATLAEARSRAGVVGPPEFWLADSVS